MLRIQGALFLMETNDAFDYTGLAKYLSIVEPHNVKGITKEEVKRLMLLTHSDRERELIHYVVHKASGGTQKKTSTTYGFRKMEEHSAHVEHAFLLRQRFAHLSLSFPYYRIKLCWNTTVVACKHD